MKKIRKDLGITNKLVVVYSGSISKYQKFDKMVDFFCILNEKNEDSF